MPKQSRGFFVCDYCGLGGIDTFEDARDHELTQCPRRLVRQQPGVGTTTSSSQPPPTPYSQQHHSNNIHITLIIQHHSAGPGSSPYTMGPLSTSDVDAYSQQHHQYYPPLPHHHPSHHHYGGSSPSKVKRLPIMHPQERSSHLTLEDNMICQSIEIFEATPEQVEEYNRGVAKETTTIAMTVVPKQVGLRCIYCCSQSTPASSSPSSSPDNNKFRIVFPLSIASVADNIRLIGDNHLVSCSMVPSDIRSACQRAADKRRQDRRQRKGTNTDDEGRLQ